MSKKADRVQELENKVNELEAQLKRAVADYHNLEKRVSEGRSELTSFMGAELVRRLLPVVDHLEQALSGVSEQEKESGWVKGVELAVKEFESVLQSEGLEEIVAGGQFDPSLHEAVDIREPSSAEASEGKIENSILEVVRKGYNLNGKVLRPAQVIVGRKADVIASEAKQSGSEKDEIATSPSAPRNDENEGDS